jgi:hypothetical protein
MNDERLELLLDAHFDENLDAEQSAELNYRLLSSPQARELFWSRARFHALLRRYGSENWGALLAETYGASSEQASEAAPSLAARLRDWFGWADFRNIHVRWALGCATALGLLVLGIFALRPERPQSKPVVEERQLVFRPGVAELVRVVNVEWAKTTNRAEPGTVLTAGPVKIKRGLIEIEFYRGARVVLEGPAEFEIVSDMEARCHSGKIRVEVPPPAHGFKVLSPSLNIIDVGTSFGMEVQVNGEAEVHVFKGKVEMASASTPNTQQSLIEGQSARVDGAGQIYALNSATTTFVSLEEIEQQARTEMRRRYHAWQVYSKHQAEDPAVLLYYDFEGKRSENNRALFNRALNATPESHGTIIGCQWTEGRWPGKNALDFKQFGDRVRFALPASLSSMTCMAWLRLDGLGHNLNSLVMAGNARAGELQWQLLQTGEILFGKRVRDGWGEGNMENFRTSPALMPEQMGLWMQLAVVYDLPSRSVRAYLNGQPVFNQEIKVITPIIFDSLEVGNWTPQLGQPIEPIRNFNGRMDEFMILGRALSAQEIATAYRAGRPL